MEGRGGENVENVERELRSQALFLMDTSYHQLA